MPHIKKYYIFSKSRFQVQILPTSLPSTLCIMILFLPEDFLKNLVIETQVIHLGEGTHKSYRQPNKWNILCILFHFEDVLANSAFKSVDILISGIICNCGNVGGCFFTFCETSRMFLSQC